MPGFFRFLQIFNFALKDCLYTSTSCSHVTHTSQSEHSVLVTWHEPASHSTVFKSVVTWHKPAIQGTVFQSRDTHHPIRNSIFFQAASFLIFHDFGPRRFLISFLNSFEMCWLKSHIIDSRSYQFIGLYLMFLVFLLLTAAPNETVHYKLILENSSLAAS